MTVNIDAGKHQLHSILLSPWLRAVGLFLTLAAVATVELLAYVGFKVPNPPAILILIVVFSAFTGGLASGMTSAVIAWLYFAYFFSIPNQPFHYTDENFRRVVLWAVATPAMVLMVAYLQRRATLAFELASVNAQLEVQIAERVRSEEEARLLHSIMLIASEAEDMAAALGGVLRKICDSSGWLLGQAWIVRDNGHLECASVWSADTTGLKHFRMASLDMTFALGVGLPGQAWSSKEIVWMDDVAQEGNFPRAREAREAGLKAGLGIPVMAGQQTVAVLEFFSREPRREDDRLKSMLVSMAVQLGTVLLRKQAEAALRRSENQLRAIIDAEPECVKILSSEGALLQMNAAGLAMIEASCLEQVLGKPVWQLVPPEHRESFRQFCESIFNGNKGKLECEIIGLKGTHRWMEMHAVPLINEADGTTLLLAVTRDITAHKEAARRLAHLAHYDSLTNLPNRVLLIQRLEEAVQHANRHERLVGIVFLDLDRFKNINDSLGHETGDALLREVAVRLCGNVRRGDTVARLSGDEFALVLADMQHVDDAAHVAQKILESFRQPFQIAGRELFVSASLGVTLYPFDDRDAHGLLRNADVAMYRAKESGKNSYQFYAAEMTAKATERLSLENDLRYALERGELFLHYQPIIDGDSCRIRGCEALLRWKHHERGVISPAQFIPLAEETGLIIPIGEWVLRTACAQCRAWQKQGFSKLNMAVNISARQFHQQDLAASIYHILQTTGLNPACLELELTEGLIMQQAETSVASLKELKAMDIRISVDDFGTGYSSLSYLKRFPIDILKIDQSFVRDIPGDADDAAIADLIITLAHSLKLKVVAEGVETVQQADFMRERHCDAMQGYYFSRPVGPDDFIKLLQQASLPCA